MNARTAFPNGVGLLDEAAELIARYPQVTQREVDRLVEIYPRLPVVEVALMISDDELGPRLKDFTRTERRRLRPPPGHFVGLLSPLVIMVIVIVFLVFF